ncbi:MAG: nucleoside monophosphate kinase [Candidatus Aenigmarchaeota archaeon]|nr:nucleoside monophosphate kinase [Candidatus Aenigmarchaeota archaeon]
MKIILFGPPASGRGKIGREVAKSLGLRLISSGYTLMKKAASDPTLSDYMRKGEVFPDKFVNEVMSKEIPMDGGFVLVGYPYSPEQARFFDASNKIDAIVEFQMGEDVIMKRVAYRVVCSDCFVSFNMSTDKPKTHGVCDLCGGVLVKREDDTPENLKMRMYYYEKMSKVMNDHYRTAGVPIVVYRVDPSATPSENASMVLAELRRVGITGEKSS